MGMASLGDVMTASIRRLDVRGPLRVCDRAIGPEGPITVKPKGLTDLTARRYGPPEGGILRVRLYSVSNLPTNGYGRSSIEYGR